MERVSPFKYRVSRSSETARECGCLHPLCAGSGPAAERVRTVSLVSPRNSPFLRKVTPRKSEYLPEADSRGCLYGPRRGSSQRACRPRVFEADFFKKGFQIVSCVFGESGAGRGRGGTGVLWPDFWKRARKCPSPSILWGKIRSVSEPRCHFPGGTPLEKPSYPSISISSSIGAFFQQVEKPFLRPLPGQRCRWSTKAYRRGGAYSAAFRIKSFWIRESSFDFSQRPGHYWPALLLCGTFLRRSRERPT